MDSELPGDLIAEDLRISLDELGEITGGQITPQETLNNIFKHFCVGK
jgi:tRNA modification GTPase